MADRTFVVERSPQRYVAGDGRLRVEFSFAGDRWQHRILVRLPWAAWLCLTSIEGTADEPAPHSPAFQDLHFESIDATTCEFQLIGQAGPAIFSGAIRISQRDGIDADISLRRRRADDAVHPASEYAVSMLPAEDVGDADVPAGDLDDTFDEATRFFQVGSLPTGYETDLQWLATGSERGVQIAGRLAERASTTRVPSAISPGVSPLTFRWRYRIEAQ